MVLVALCRRINKCQHTALSSFFCFSHTLKSPGCLEKNFTWMAHIFPLKTGAYSNSAWLLEVAGRGRKKRMHVGRKYSALATVQRLCNLHFRSRTERDTITCSLLLTTHLLCTAKNCPGPQKAGPPVHTRCHVDKSSTALLHTARGGSSSQHHECT